MSKKNNGVKEIVEPKIAKNNLVPKLLLGPNIFLVHKMLGLKNVRSQKVWVRKNCGFNKLLGPKKKTFVQRKFWFQKNFSPKKICCLKKFWVQKNLGSKKFCDPKKFAV